jgi:hypothetical protein
MRPILLSLIVVTLFIYSCQPNCRDILLDTNEALVFRFSIIDKVNGDNLIGQSIAYDDLELIGIDEDNERGIIEYSQIDTVEKDIFISTLLFVNFFERTPLKKIIINYNNIYTADTLDIDYHYKEEECGNYLGDYTISSSDEVICYRCYQNIINIEK